MFSALYGTNPHISNIQKMYYFLLKTEGKARDIIRTCPMTNNGFDMAWKNLVDRYENKRVLVNSQLKNLFNLSVIERESVLQSSDCRGQSMIVLLIYPCSGLKRKIGTMIGHWKCDNILGLWEQSQGSNSCLSK